MSYISSYLVSGCHAHTRVRKCVAFAPTFDTPSHDVCPIRFAIRAMTHLHCALRVVTAAHTIRAHRPADGRPRPAMSCPRNRCCRIACSPMPLSNTANTNHIFIHSPVQEHVRDPPPHTSINLLHRSTRRYPLYRKIWPQRGSFVFASVFVRRFDLSLRSGNRYTLAYGLRGLPSQRSVSPLAPITVTTSCRFCGS